MTHEQTERVLDALVPLIEARKPAVLRGLVDGPLITLSELSAHLNSCSPLPKYLKYIEDGCAYEAPVIRREWRMEWDGEAINRLWRSGRSFIVHNGRINGAISAIVSAVDERFGAECDAHMYLGTSASGSFRIHSDWPDNLIIQAEGRTRWTVYGERWNPDKILSVEDIESKVTVAFDEVLEPGDAVFIDGTRAHLARPLTTRLSVSFPIKSGSGGAPKFAPIDLAHYS